MRTSLRGMLERKSSGYGTSNLSLNPKSVSQDAMKLSVETLNRQFASLQKNNFEEGTFMNTPEFLAALRNEIIEAQKMEAEYIKWKLIAVSSVASISLGFTPGSPSPTSSTKLDLLLCAIPLICAYIDFASINVMLRIATIGAYLRRVGSEYEKFVSSCLRDDAKPFTFQTMALYGSTFIFNFVLIGMSFTTLSAPWVQTAYLLGGLSGLVVGIFSWMLCNMKLHRLDEMSKRNC